MTRNTSHAYSNSTWAASLRISRAMRAVAALILTLSAGTAVAQDTELQIRQVPKEKHLQEDARDEGLANKSVPDRCSDPDVAASDPACVDQTEEAETSDAKLPSVEDTADDKIDLLPGVTINKSAGSRR